MAGGTFYGTRTQFLVAVDTLGMKRIRTLGHGLQSDFIRFMTIEASDRK